MPDTAPAAPAANASGISGSEPISTGSPVPMNASIVGR